MGRGPPQDERFSEELARSLSIALPLSLRFRKEESRLRLSEELPVELLREELVSDPKRSLPSLPPKLTIGLHWARSTIATNADIANAILFI